MTFLRKILQSVLRFFAVAILNKYKPKVVAITGSVGKSSTVSAIESVLMPSFSVRKSLKNYNNEFGIPLSIIGSLSAGRKIYGWLQIFFHATALLVYKDKDYPEILILEMGADRPGDLEHLASFVKIDIGVVTNVAEAHLEFFETIDSIAYEKSAVIRSLGKSGIAIINDDDIRVRHMKDDSSGKVLSYGTKDDSDIIARNIKVETKDDLTGVSFDVEYNDKKVKVLLPNVVAEHFVYAALAAIGVGISLGLHLEKIIEALKEFKSPPGRMKILPGIKSTTIIDDTYNSSPLSAKKALRQLRNFKGQKKFAVLGDMLELGKYTKEAHEEVGKTVFDYKIDYLITVGEASKDTMHSAIKSGMSEDRCFDFSKSDQAGRFVQDRIKSGDIILIKGSQGVRMERIVKEIMAEPQKAEELLVRQDAAWGK